MTPDAVARGSKEQATDMETGSIAGGPPTLVLHGVSKRWAGRTVLDEADLVLERSVSASVIGHNGTGKTTLLRIVAGLILPEAGTIVLDGVRQEDDRREYQRRLGYVSSGDGGLYARLKVKQNLEFWAGLAFVAPSQRRAAIERSLARFGLEPLATRRADRLSLGQRQRVRLAAAFLHEPQLVLLDEPFSSLDDQGADQLMAAIRELTGRGGSALACAPAEREGVSFQQAYILADGGLYPA
ncbi:MAG: ABC transporter ATP-binding protein [Actinomycetota bacterium]|nr:ABC transporter ATP-binding protein [Actinomycetota bacterium]